MFLIRSKNIFFTFTFKTFIIFFQTYGILYGQYEIPKFHLDTQIVKHNGFTLSYSEEHEQPWWVAYDLDEKEVRGKVKRSNKFKIDPFIKSGSATLKDYKGSGFDRGHLAPAGDMKWSKKSMDDSFFMSNISPQVPSFNRGIWKKLESMVRRWAEDNKKVYITTGPIFSDSDESIGENNVTIPRAYFKVILDYTLPKYKSIGFVLPNQKSKEHLSNYVYTVDEIEAILDIDFFYLLEDDIEETIESNYNLSDWGIE